MLQRRGSSAAAAGRLAWMVGLIGLGLLACGGGRVSPTPDSGTAPPSVLDESRSSVVVIGATRLAANGVAETRVKVTLIDTLGQPMSGIRVDLEASGAGPGFSVSGLTSRTGIFTAAVSSRVAGVETVSATAHVSTGLTPLFEHPTIDFVPGAAAQLVFAPRPETFQAGLGLQVVVEVADAQGNVVPSTTPDISVKLSRAPKGAVLLGTRTRTAVGGVARFDDLTLITVGTGYVLTATAKGFDPVQSTPFEVIAGPPVPVGSHLDVTQSFATADGVEAQTLSLHLVDSFGQPCAGIPVELAATDPAVRFDPPPSGRTDVQGNFQAKVRSTHAGHPTVSVTAEGLTFSTAVSFSAGPVDATKSTFTLPSTPVVANGVPNAEMTAHLTDAFGNPTYGPVLLVLTDPEGNVSADVTAYPVANGNIERSFGALKAGRYTLEVDHPYGRGTPLFTGTIDFVAGRAARLEFQEVPARFYANEKTSFVVAVVDANDNIVQDEPPTAITLDPRSSGERPALEGTLTRTTVKGIARFDDVRVDHSVTGLRLEATSGALEGESAPFDVRAFRPVGPAGGNISAVRVDASAGLVFAGTHGSGLFESKDGGRSFFPVDLGIGGADVSSLFQPSSGELAVTTSNEGIVWTTLGSGTWQSWSSGLPDSGMHAIASGSNGFWVGTSAGISTTPTVGGTWSPLGNAPTDVRAILGPAMSLVATGSGQLFQRSGSGWTDLGLDLGGPATAIATGANGRAYVASRGGGLFESGDFALHWFRVDRLGSLEVNALSIPAPGKLYVATEDEGLMTSSDFGSSWAEVSPLLPTRVNAVTTWPGNPEEVFIGTPRGLYLIDGAGAEPVEVDLFANEVHALAFDPAKPGALYAATDQGVFHLDALGQRWQARSGDLPRTAFVSIQVDPTQPGTLYVASADGRVFASADSGQSWAERSQGLAADDLVALVMAPSHPSTLYALSKTSGLFVTTDGAASWQAETALPSVSGTALAADPAAPGRLYLASSDQGVFTSSDGGKSWQAMSAGLGSTDVRALWLSEGTLYAGTAAGVFSHVAGAASWSALGGPGGTVEVLAADPSAPGTLYAATADGIFRTEDSGATWTPAAEPTARVRAFAFDPAQPGVLWVATDGQGTLVTRSGGT